MTQNSVRDGVSYTDARQKLFWNGILVCVLSIKNLQNCVWACSVTKIPLVVSKHKNLLTILLVLSLQAALHLPHEEAWYLGL